jgi:hypothetical protein
LRKSSRGLAAVAGGLMLIFPGCGGHSGPTSPSCSSLAGAWAEIASDSCGARAEKTATVSQSECSFSLDLGIASVQGTINGNSFTFTGTTAAPCSVSVSGSGSMSGPAINGTYTGTSPGGAGCCPAGTFTGSFSLIR